MEQVPPCDQDKREATADVEQQQAGDSTPSSAHTSHETPNDDGENMEQADIETEHEIVPSAKASPLLPPPEDGTPDSAKGSATSPADDDDKDRGDNKREPRSEAPTEESELCRKDVTGPNGASETPDPGVLGDGQVDQVDGPAAELLEKSETIGGDGATEGTEGGPGHDSSEREISKGDEMEEVAHEGWQNVENIGPVAQESPASAVPEAPGVFRGRGRFLIFCGVLVLAMLLNTRQPASPLPKSDVDRFLWQMEKAKTQFPHQRVELWTRSRIHLMRHLQATQPAAPVSLILTAGVRAERTLHCLARTLASAFSFARNASALHIDAVGKASQDSDQVKLDLDRTLQGAFGGDQPVAVIHRLEELPPGSTLIFYRYCDHENAAFKESVLIFTVLLDKEEIPAGAHLNAVEELVDDHLQRKFLSRGGPVSFDRMDLDKYGGLWSRISHLILPVATEDSVEQGGCTASPLNFK